MKTSHKQNFFWALLILSVLANFNALAQPDTWTQKANYGGGITFSGVGFSIGTKGYIGLGDNAMGTQYQSIWEYDPATDAWTQKADFGGGTRGNAFAFTVAGKAYVGTGYNSVAQQDMWEFDPTTNSWTQKSNFPGGIRVRAVAFSIGAKGYVGTGNDGTSFKKDFWEYEPATDTWTQKADFAGTARMSATGFSIGSKGYLGTGWGASSNFKDFWEYDVATDTWTQKADAGNTNRYEAVGFSIGSKGYICTGGEWPVYTKDLLEYDPSIDCWIKRADFGGAVRALASGFAVGGKGYVGTANFQVDLWEYTPAASSPPPPVISSFAPTSGGVGLTITITGTDFTGTSVVSFNGTPATSFTVVSPTSITATVPLATTTGPISVRAGCNIATSTGDFTITTAENSLKFNGANQEGQLGTWFNYQNFTVSMWVKPGATQVTYANIVDNNHSGIRSWVFQQDANNINQYSFNGAPNVSLQANIWQHITLTKLAGTYSVYVDGCLVSQLAGPATLNYDGTQLLRLANWGGGGRNWNGEIDEVKIYDRALSDAEVKADVYTPISPSTANLQAYYKVTEAGGSFSADATANNRHATLINSPTFQLSGIPSSGLPVPTITSFTPAFGAPGTTVTITGTNFSSTLSDNIVKFNGSSATVTASTPTSITATVPASASTGLITIQVGSPCNLATSSTAFIVPVCFPANGQNADVVIGQNNFTTNTPGSGANKFTGAGGGIAIHFATGKVFIADQGNNRVLRFSSLAAATTGSSAEAVLGQPDFTTVSAGLSQTKMNAPVGLVIDQTSGTLWVAEISNNRVIRFDNAVGLANGAPANGVLGQPNFTTNSASVVNASTLGSPTGVALDANGNLWTAERAWNRVLKFANAAALPNGAAASVVLGQTNFTSAVPGTSQTSFNRTNSVAVDIAGNLWVADELNNRVLKFANAATLTTGAPATTVLGQIDFLGNSIGTAQNKMYGPIGLHADPFGNIWVGDWANQRALQFANAASLSNGANATKVLGSPNFTSIAGGIAQNRTGVVWAIAVDNIGNIYIGDQGNNRILRFNAPKPTAANVSVCGSNAVTLTATGAVALQEYRWYDSPTGGTLLSSTADFVTPTLAATTTYYVSLVDGGCSYESGRVPVTATILLLPNSPLVNALGTSCPGSVTITATSGSPGQYRWYSVASGGTHDAAQTNDTFITPTLTGSTSFWVAINDGACESVRTEVSVAIALPTAPGVLAVNPVCPGSNTSLTATGGTNGNYRWYDNGVLIPGEVNNTFTITNLIATKNFQVSIHNGICESIKTSVTATVQNCTAPSVASTTATAFIEGIVTIDLEELVTDDEDNVDPSGLQITMQPVSGAAATLNGFKLTIDYTGLPFTGSDEVGIEVCDLTALCTTQQLTIELSGEFQIFNAVSPDGNGKNETFIIQYIDVLPETKSNQVFIYNRWGDEVFSVRDYNNTDRVFKGENKNGHKLPVGTYFYKIVFANDQKPLTGFLELKY